MLFHNRPFTPSISAKKLISILVSISFTSYLAAAERPNVLIFFIDDMGVTDIGVNGSSFYETPNIDALAKSGANFTNAYSAHPVCSPTRASLMTGKAPQRVGITQWINNNQNIGLPLEEITIGEAFKEAGYRTGYIGKWHLGKSDNFQPKNQGFDYTVAVNRAGQPASFFYPFKKGERLTNVPDLADYKKGNYLTDALTDKSIEFIDQADDKPFFLCLAHYAVHTPIQAPKPLVEKYKTKKTAKYGDEKAPLIDGKYNKKVYTRQQNASYAAMVENLDTNIGRVLSHLKEKKLLDNTIVIFSSDNGGFANNANGPTSNLPYRSGKAWTYEGGMRIPTIISWLGKIQPLTTKARTITMDIYPTLLELCDIPAKPKQHLDGISLEPLLMGEIDDQILKSRLLAWSYPHNHSNGHRPSHAIVDGVWKLIQFDNDEPTELYNLSLDIAETTNIASDHPEKVSELSTKLNDWLKETAQKNK